MAYKNVLEIIGNTPEVKINRLFGENANVFIKLERLNPGGSIKDRIALAMVEDAEAKGILNKDSVIVEPTSGNTGVGLALVAAVKGYKLIVVMPESMSIERRKLVAAYGAEVVLTPKEKGTGGAVAKALEIAEGKPNYWVPQQFQNPANPAVHERTTAQEILKSFPEGFDYFVTEVLPISKEEAYEFARRLAKEEGILAGISTGAALAAVSKVLEKNPKARILTINYDTGERYWSVEGLY